MLFNYYGADAPTLHWAGLPVHTSAVNGSPAHLRKLRDPRHICKAPFVSRYITCTYAASVRTKVLRLASYYVLRAPLHFALLINIFKNNFIVTNIKTKYILMLLKYILF